MASIPYSSQDVVSAAQVLRVSERQLFQLAYHAAYDACATTEELESALMPYMYDGMAPIWVTSFAREVLITQGHRFSEQAVVPNGWLAGFVDLAIALYVPPHKPETLGPERYSVFLA